MYKQSWKLRLHVQHGLRVVQGQWDSWFLHREVREWRKGWRSVSEEQDLCTSHVSTHIGAGQWKDTVY